MKVDTEELSEQWADALSIRIQLPLLSETSHFEASDEESEPKQVFSLPAYKTRLTRSSPANLVALRNLPVEAPLVLFTPFLLPAVSKDTLPDEVHRRDPFETLGRQIAKHHPNICHVPYVASIGFTETHLGFVLDSEAVITVVCEPRHSLKKESMSEQHGFAEAALKAFVSRPTGLSGDDEYVLVQCATDDVRRPPRYGFANVVETTFYNDQAAVHLADFILGHT